MGGVVTTYEYQYDELGQLVAVLENGATVATFTYDGNGNRIAENGIVATYDAQDRLTQFGNIFYTYTLNGELVSKTQGTDTTTYTYDVMGNLLSVTLPDSTVIEYIVDGVGRRVVKKKDGVVECKFLYSDNLHPVAELDQNDELISLFIYGANERTPEYMIKNGETFRIVTDHLGSVRLVVNVSDGTIAQRMDYDAFGDVVLDTNPGFQPFGFAGGLYDPDTGLVRFGLRDYDPQAGRWTAKDPVRFGGSRLGLYTYVNNDPVNSVDPLGLGPKIAEGYSWVDWALNKVNLASESIEIVADNGIPAFKGLKRITPYVKKVGKKLGPVGVVTDSIQFGKTIYDYATGKPGTGVGDVIHDGGVLASNIPPLDLPATLLDAASSSQVVTDMFKSYYIEKSGGTPSAPSTFHYGGGNLGIATVHY